MTGKKLILVFFTAQLMDMITTYIALHYFGQTELNPVASSLFRNIGAGQAMILKIVVTYFIIVLYAFSLDKIKIIHRSVLKSMQIGSLIIWVVVIINVTGILSLMFYPT